MVIAQYKTDEVKYFKTFLNLFQRSIGSILEPFVEHQQEHFVLIQLPKLESKNFQTHFQRTKLLAELGFIISLRVLGQIKVKFHIIQSEK